MNPGFIFREGVTGLRRNLSMTIALILTTSISLALLGTGLLVGKMAADTKQLYLDKVEAMVQLSPELSASDKDCSSSQCSDIKKQLESNNKVDSVTYMNQQDSYNRFVQLFQDSDPQLVKDTQPNAIPGALHVRLKDPTDTSPLQDVEHHDGVDQVVDQSKDVKGATDNLDAIKNATLMVAIVQGIAAVLLIGNMVLLSVRQRSEQLAIMRIVGANRWMTDAPFMLEAMLATLIGGIVGTVGMVLSNTFVVSKAMAGLYDSQLVARVTNTEIWQVMPIVDVAGIVIAGTTAALTLRRTVRK